VLRPLNAHLVSHCDLNLAQVRAELFTMAKPDEDVPRYPAAGLGCPQDGASQRGTSQEGTAEKGTFHDGTMSDVGAQECKKEEEAPREDEAARPLDQPSRPALGFFSRLFQRQRCAQVADA